MTEQNRIVIPESFLLVVDDVGWWLCADKRYYAPVPDHALRLNSRSYSFEDYRSLVELGRAMNMRILCGFTIGEWDRDNILKNVPNSNMRGKNWDNYEVFAHAERLDEVRDYINSNSAYIEMAVHGLNHMYWDDETGKCYFAEYYHNEDGKRVMTKPDVMRQHMDAWFEIYSRNGFKAKVDKLIPPCFAYNYSRGDGELSYILKDYGIKYISTPFNSMGFDTPEKPVMACVENGILTTDRTSDLTAWYELDAETPNELKSSYYGTHWPHFIALDPADNMKTVARWAEYFKQYKNKFDVVCAADHVMGANQAFYRRFTRMVETADNYFTLDFTEADAQGAPADVVGNEVYLNVVKPFRLIAADDSCTVELYNAADDFRTYKLTRHGIFANVILA